MYTHTEKGFLFIDKFHQIFFPLGVSLYKANGHFSTMLWYYIPDLCSNIYSIHKINDENST